MTNLRVLIIDDDESIRHMLTVVLEKEGYLVDTAHDGQDALQKILANNFELVLCDIRMPQMNGIELLSQLQQLHPDLTIIMMSAFGSRKLAIEAIKQGAYDYIDKPFGRDEILITLFKAIEHRQLKRENDHFKKFQHNHTFHGIVGQSDSMRKIFQTIEKISQYRSTVLLQGESGTGKELVARAIHQLSPRHSKPYITVNCGAIPEFLMESELFGHIKGAFTDAVNDKKGLFQQADGGTLFLDEIAELTPALQVKLLRVLQENEIRRIGDSRVIAINVRVIAATHHDLFQRVQDGLFREDLYYRLDVIQLKLPPLRDRRDDIPLLVDYFLKALNEKLGTSIRGITPAAMKQLTSYSWPGNIRELQNCIERCLVLSHNTTLDIDDLPSTLVDSSPNMPALFQTDELSIKKMAVTMEKTLIARALKQTEGNRTHAAKLLEISHRALLYKIKQYQLD